MSRLLQIDSSPVTNSISRELLTAYVDGWKAANPTGSVTSRSLYDPLTTPVDERWIAASYTPEESRTEEQKELLSFSNELIAELHEADEIAIGVAMHNFSITAALKLWIDQVVRRGKTFSYGPDGKEGLLKGKKATVLIATGGVYEPGTPAAEMNFVEPYLRAILGFLGITDVQVVTASGVARVVAGAIGRDAFLKPIVEQVRALTA